MSTQDEAAPLRVHHLAVKVRDLTRAEAFYAGALGLPVLRRQHDERGELRSVWLALGDADGPAGTFLALERAESPEPVRDDAAPGWHCVALAIAPTDRQSWRARLTARGYPIVRETPYTLYVRDPEGAIVALSHHPHAAAEHLAPAADRSDAPAPAPGSPSAAMDGSPIDAGPDTALDASGRSGVTSRLAALVTLSVALVAILGSPAPLGAQRPNRPADAILLGSSSIHGALGRLIEEHFERLGLRVRRVGHSSTGLARPDFFDWQAEIPHLGDLSALRGVVVYLGGNDTQAIRLRRSESPDRGPRSWIPWRDEERWTAVYVSRMRAFVEGLCDAGARRAIVLLPADGEREGWAERIHRVQRAQIAGVRGTRCGVVIDPRGPEVRRGDTVDGVHLSRRGVLALLRRIGPPLLAALTA